jgi:alkylhydroperoxidase family enzyme
VLGAELTRQVLDDYATAPIDEPLRATLGFLKKMTLSPEALTAADARAVLAHGIGKEKLADAIHVAAAFNMYDRLADTFAWHVPVQAAMNAGAKILLKRGYR